MRPAIIVTVLALGAALLSVAAYAFFGAAQDKDASRKGSRLLLGVGDFFLHWFLWAVSPLERLLLGVPAAPDILNIAGLGLGLASGVALGLGALELGAWGIALAGICDVLDGRVARARNLASPYGKFIDSTLDRFVETFVFLGLIAYFRDRPLGAFFAAASMGGSLLVSYAQARGETVAVAGSGGLMQRAERLVLIFLVCLFDPILARWRGWSVGTVLLWVLALMAVATFGTAIYRTIWIARRLR
jgi:phosphatidylglycerophosphate synthase